MNLAIRRTPKPHVTIKYLKAEFVEVVHAGAAAGWCRDGGQDTRFHGRELARNAAVGGLALASGLRLQEFTYLLVYEIPALPPKPTEVPIPFAVPSGVTKGPEVPHDLDFLMMRWPNCTSIGSWGRAVTVGGGGRMAAAAAMGGTAGRVVTAAHRTGRADRTVCRRSWDGLTPGERRRLIAPDGGSCLIAVRNGGGPFTAWASVFERTSRPGSAHASNHDFRT